MEKSRERPLYFNRVLGLIGAFIGASITAHAANTANMTIGVEPSYFTGNYGTSQTVRIYDVPLSVSYRSGPWWLHAQFSYLAITGNALISGATVISSSMQRGARSGAGDLWLEGRYQLNRATGLTPSVSPYVKLKLPTASRAQGFGTGSVDEEVGARFSWSASNRLYPFAQLGYRFVGRAGGLNLQDVTTYGAGASLVLQKQHYFTLLISGHTAIQQGMGPTAELLAAYTMQFTRQWRFQLYADHGLTTNSAQYGGGLGVYRRF